MELKLILLNLVVIFLIFYIINKNLHIKEGFLTYYIPFLGTNNLYINKISKFYINNDNMKNYFKQKFNYNVILIGSYEKEKEFVTFFMNLFISKTMLYQIENRYYNNKLELLKQLDNNNINIGFTNIPTLSLYASEYSSYLSRIFAITPVYKEYLIIATKLKYGIFKLSNIPLGFEIGILDNQNTIFYYYKKILTDLKLNVNDYKFKVYNSDKTLIEAFYKDEVNLILYFSDLPNSDVDKMIDYNFEKDIIFLPFELSNKLFNQFRIKNSFAEIESFDLNKVSGSYLPKKFGDYEFRVYKPDMKFLVLDQLMVTNSFLNYDTVYNIAQFFVKYTDLLNKSLPENVKIPKFRVDTELVKFMNYHPSSVKLFGDYGFQTFEDNPYCKYFVGKKKCDKKTLVSNGFA